MSEPFLAEVRMAGFNFAPRGHALCDGQILPISQNQSLYSLLGTTYGGDGRTTFALPDLRGRVPIHVGQGSGADWSLGERGGEEGHALSDAEIPSHTHTMAANTAAADSPSPNGTLYAPAPVSVGSPYSGAGQNLDVSLKNTAVGPGGSGQQHPNLMPYQTISFMIAIAGLFPSRN